jgi:hypothetical protein
MSSGLTTIACGQEATARSEKMVSADDGDLCDASVLNNTVIQNIIICIGFAYGCTAAGTYIYNCSIYVVVS